MTVSMIFIQKYFLQHRIDLIIMIILISHGATTVLPFVGYGIGIYTGSMPGQNNNPHNHSDLILETKNKMIQRIRIPVCIYMLQENETIQVM